MPWRQLAKSIDCPIGASLEAIVQDRVVALFNVEGRFFALDGICPHQGGPLGEGGLSGCVVTCPWHGWQFDVRTGQNLLSRTIQQPRFETKVEDGIVWVELPE